MGVLRTGAIALAMSLAASAAGMGCTGPPCHEDPLGCGEGSDEFAIDPSCELTGELDVTLGEGHTGAFEPYALSQEPTVHEGAQGGHHLCLGIRVDRPALDYPHLQVVLDAEFASDTKCDGAQTECDPWVNTGHREMVLGPELPLNGDRVEETDFILIISLWPEELLRRVRVDVVDPCGRTGAAEHMIAATAG